MPSFRIPFYCTRVKKQLFTFVSIKRDAFDLVSTLLFFLSCRNAVISRARDEKIKKRNNIFDFYAIGTRIYRHVHNMTVMRARARFLSPIVIGSRDFCNPSCCRARFPNRSKIRGDNKSRAFIYISPGRRV